MRRPSCRRALVLGAVLIGGCGGGAAATNHGQAGGGGAGTTDHGQAGASAGANGANGDAGSAGPAGQGQAGASDGGAPATGTSCRAMSPDQWTATSATDAPTPVARMLSVWTGKVLVVFGAADGGVFDPCANTWRRASIDGMPPQLPAYQDSLPYPPVVVGTRIVVLFPGTMGHPSAEASTISAAVYDLAADEWTTVPVGGAAPAPREQGAVVSTGTELILWSGVVTDQTDGGTGFRHLADGARLDPTAGRWKPMAAAGAPVGRSRAGALWTGSRFVVVGGNTQTNPSTCDVNGTCDPAAAGGVYDPTGDSWLAIPTDGAPRLGPVPYVRWNGKRAVVWRDTTAGGHGIYDPAANRWEPMPAPPGLPSGTRWPLLAWLDGDRFGVADSLTAAAVYDLTTSTWTPVAAAKLPASGAISPPILGNDRLFESIGTPGTLGTTSLASVQGGWIARVDVAKARWEVATLPVAASPVSLVGILVWTGDRLVDWGGQHWVPDPTGANGCEHVQTGFGCDPVVPMKTIYESGGGLLSPTFAPAPAP
jgi:hypothetical protein